MQRATKVKFFALATLTSIFSIGACGTNAFAINSGYKMGNDLTKCPVSGQDYISQPTNQDINSAAFKVQDRYSQIGNMFFDPCADNREDARDVYENDHQGDTSSNIVWLGGFNNSLANLDIENQTGMSDQNIYQLTNLSITGTDQNALDTLNKLIDDNKMTKYVIISAAENENAPLELLEKQIDEILIKLSSGRTLILATAYDLQKDYSAINSSIRALVEKKENVIVADWAKFVETSTDQSRLFQEDGKTLTEYGKKQWIRVIYSAIPGKTSLQNNRSNQAIIWNYFADPKATDLQGAMTAIAGIMTNIESLSGSNPFYYDAQTGNFGLFAENSPKLLALMQEAGLDKYWNQEADFATNERAIELQLDYYTNRANAKESKVAKAYSDYVAAPNHAKTYQAEYVRAQEYAEQFSKNLNIIANTTGNQSIVISNGKNAENKTEFLTTAQKTYFINASLKPTTLANNKLAHTSQNPTNKGVFYKPEWKNGWIIAGQDGYIRESALVTDYKIKDATYAQSFATFVNNHRGANKITLIAPEKSTTTNDVLSLYNGNPPHITVDIKNHQSYQHLPITNPATALNKQNRYAGIQIAVIDGTIDTQLNASSQSYTEEDWQYLSRIIYIIADQIGLDEDELEIITGEIGEKEFRNFEGVAFAESINKNAETNLQAVKDQIKAGLDYSYIHYGNTTNNDI